MGNLKYFNTKRKDKIKLNILGLEELENLVDIDKC